jgi:hypothetical protein
MGQKNTVICQSAFPAPALDSGRVFVEVDIDFAESGRTPLPQSKVALTGHVTDTIRGEGDLITFVTRRSLYIVHVDNYYANAIEADRRGFDMVGAGLRLRPEAEAVS